MLYRFLRDEPKMRQIISVGSVYWNAYANVLVKYVTNIDEMYKCDKC